MVAPFEWLATEPASVRRMLIDRLSQRERNAFDYQWAYTARPEQLPPPGDWRV